MIEAKLFREQGILVVAPSGELTSTDFEQLRRLVDPYIEKRGSLNGLLIDAEAFPRWEEFSNMLSQLRFVGDYESKIARVAAVTDSDFLAILPKVADYFIGAEVRHFAYQDRDTALAWLQHG
jgi:hypothetical protein